MAVGTGIETQGTTIGISVDGVTYTQIGCVKSFDLERGSRSDIDTTCLTDSIKTSKRGIEEKGKLSLDMYFDMGAGYTLAEASFEADVNYFFEIVLADASVGTFEGQVNKLINMSGDMDAVLEGSMEISVQTKPAWA